MHVRQLIRGAYACLVAGLANEQTRDQLAGVLALRVISGHHYYYCFRRHVLGREDEQDLDSYAAQYEAIRDRCGREVDARHR